MVDADAEAEEAPELLAVGRVEAEAADARRGSRSRSSRVAIFTLVSACASSAHSRCVKLTT